MKKQKKCILIDKLLAEGWFSDQSEAMPWIMAGKVLINEQPATSRSEKIPADSIIRVREYYKRKYVNKGGLKLEGALKDFNIDIKGKTALDCGASTGGFTDCLISHGAAKIYAVDVGHGQLAGKLLTNPNVINMEKTNLSDSLLLTLNPIPEIITLDLSYLSLIKALPICNEIFKEKEGHVICLVKPLFEIESPEIRRSGKINDKNIMIDILKSLCDNFTAQKMNIIGVTNSPVTGNNGTIEYFIHIKLNENNKLGIYYDIDEGIINAVDKSFAIERFSKNDY